MNNVVNLRRERKKRLREEDVKKAEQNRIFHGRTLSEKRLSSLEKERFEKILDGKKRNDSESDAP
ncbi:hypothetical protein AA106555_0740 [Neokomagataea thailandica NBRC 106555]|uniref:DUF4169 family protein n=2 Tax=Neokomagataea TaxID=1223423 RepID=A0A4Y6V542_9PROT|nr:MULTISPECIES: DUF4169 family protein [Neokomagataea]QDH25169.1 DUF4169 family protein [Neokomagataea tanensis]GBR51943.1 hypothetical protein AA106555_0740 [Neokomagataea thailandica NBRC 106555]